MSGYKDPRYYAGMAILAPAEFAGEIAYNKNALAKFPHDAGLVKHHTAALAIITRGGELAREDGFAASFLDPQYGFGWWLKAGRPSGVPVAEHKSQP